MESPKSELEVPQKKCCSYACWKSANIGWMPAYNVTQQTAVEPRTSQAEFQRITLLKQAALKQAASNRLYLPHILGMSPADMDILLACSGSYGFGTTGPQDVLANRRTLKKQCISEIRKQTTPSVVGMHEGTLTKG